MTGTGNSVATRPNGVAQAQASAALELRSGQTMWTRDQHAALVAMGIPKEATSAELGVFLHQCQRTGLDPFSKQIYLIYRPGYENGRPVNKPTTQVGIDGFRVIRDRIARRDGLRVEYGDTLWYTADGQSHDVWLWSEPPAACKFVVLVDGRRFPATLNFGEYVQKKKDGTVNKMWTEKAAHMIEKCAEADALRRAFPHDMAGVILEDAAPLPEDAPEPARQRVTAADARARNPQTVTAVAEPVTPDVPPAGEQPDASPSPAAASPTPPEAPAGGTPDPERESLERQVTAQLARILKGEPTPVVASRWACDILGFAEAMPLSDLKPGELQDVADALGKVRTRAELQALLKTGEVPGGS